MSKQEPAYRCIAKTHNDKPLMVQSWYCRDSTILLVLDKSMNVVWSLKNSFETFSNLNNIYQHSYFTTFSIFRNNISANINIHKKSPANAKGNARQQYMFEGPLRINLGSSLQQLTLGTMYSHTPDGATVSRECCRS